MIKHRSFVFICCICVSFTGKAKILENTIYSPNIKTVELYPKYNEMAMPIIGLGGSETLELHFDELSPINKTYYYTIQQCQSNWEPTSMSQIEYLNGFTESTISDYTYSNATKQTYVHYTLEIPNNDMQITKSGNYVLIVYTDSPDEPLFIRRFMILEPRVAINAHVVYPRNISDRNKYQEVTFTINHKGFQIDHPQTDIKATVLQNYRWDNAKTAIQPYLVGLNEVSYDYNGLFLFPTGREFRQFDTRSLRFKGINVRAFDLSDDRNKVYLLYDSPLQTQKYMYYKDLSGQYYIQTLDYPDSYVNADYTWVHFNLAFPNPLANGNFYVVGAFNNWICDSLSQMQYDPEDKSYFVDIYLKQGYYNYSYEFWDKSLHIYDQSLTEGYYGETDNDYTILVYYTPFGERYDRLVGVEHINSVLDRY